MIGKSRVSGNGLEKTLVVLSDALVERWGKSEMWKLIHEKWRL
jgi:hypothetical protein